MKNNKNDQTQNAIQGINLKAIQRQVEPRASSVKFTTPRCAIYIFNEDSSKWNKSDIEGSLFIYEYEKNTPNNVQAETLHQLIPELQTGMALTILNKSNDGMIKQDICPTLDIQVSEPYLLYKTSSDPEIKGIWFNDMSAFREAQKLIESELKRVKNTTKLFKKSTSQEPRPPEMKPNFEKREKKRRSKKEKISISPKHSPKLLTKLEKSKSQNNSQSPAATVLFKKSISQPSDNEDILDKLFTAERIHKISEKSTDSSSLVLPVAEKTSKIGKKKNKKPEQIPISPLASNKGFVTNGLLTPDVFLLPTTMTQPINIQKSISDISEQSIEFTESSLANGLSKSQESVDECVENGEDPDEKISNSERAFARRYLIDFIQKDDRIVDGFINQFRTRLDQK